MAKDYIVCSGNTQVTYPTYFSAQSNCELDFQNLTGIYNKKLYQVRTNPLGTPPYSHAAYDYNYRIHMVGMINGESYFDEYVTGTILVPSGVTDYQFYLRCSELLFDYGGPGQDLLVTYTYTEHNQQYIPICYVPPSCTLSIDSAVGTGPTILNGTDGSIAVTFSSTSGSTANYYINGDYKGIQGTGFTFTGLTSGSYNIYLEQSGCTDSTVVVVPAGEFKTGAFSVITPATITAVENPVILSLATYVSSFNPKQSINTIVVTGGTISAVTITFNLDYPQIYNAVFQSKGYPDRSTYFLESILKDQLGNPYGSNSNTEIATSLAECLQNDSIIGRLYFITNSGTTITMTSKEVGDMYDLPAQVTIVGSGITLTNTQSGVVSCDGQISADYSLYAELFVNPNSQFGAAVDTSTFERVAEIELPFNESNIHKFDLSAILKNFVSSPKMDFTMTGFTTLNYMDTNYFVKYGEKYPLIPNTNTKKKRYKGTTGVLYTLNSALNFEDANDMSSYLGTATPSGSTTYTGVTFMNTAPNPKYIPRGSKEWLYYLLPTQYPNALSLKGDIYYYNGTSQTGITFITITNLTGATNFGGVTALAAGYDELGLGAYEASGNTKIRRIDFAVWQTPSSGASTMLTETRSYLLEIDEQPQKFNVCWLNKLGTYETFSFVGEVVEDQEIIRQNYQAPYSVNVDGSASDGFQYNGVYDTQYTKLWTVNSGTVDSDTYYYLMGLLQSNKIYNYSNPHENFLTVVSQTAQKSTNSAEWTVQVVFKETIFENQVEK